MKMKGSIAVFAVAAAFAGNVAAQARVYCVDLIKVLEDQTIEAPFTNDRDRTSELGKLTDARLKLSARKPKYADAQQKMGDYLLKLNQVNAAGKFDDPGQTIYWTLYNGANDVIACIETMKQ